jgi:hypothetical protein
MRCNKENTVYPYYGSVTVTENFAANNTIPDFGAGDKVYFTAKFAQNANWTIKIVGQTTGAVKTISGIGTEVNASNSTWNGSADAVPSFKVENVTATLSFQGDNKTYSLNLSIGSIKKPDANEVLVTNFAVSKVKDGNYTDTVNWQSDFLPTSIANAYPLADGNSYLSMSGKPWQVIPGTSNISPYIDYLRIYSTGADTPYGPVFPVYANPSSVYFNILVYNTGTKNTWLQVNISEANGATRNINIYPDWTGWKLLSYNYSQFSTDPSSLHPNQIKKIDFVLLSKATQDVLNQKAEVVSTAFDHPVFTFNKPWQP